MDVNGARERVPGADAPLDDVDAAILGRIKQTVELLDPVPDGLAERSLFAMTLAALEAEVMQLQHVGTLEGAVRGDKAPAEARTITFTHDILTVMIALSPSDDGGVRIDGWISPPAAVPIELRQPAGERVTTSDADGRFSFASVDRGPASLLVRDAGSETPVATPVVEL